ncbi:MAG TPA: ATP-binding protein [Chthoniobacteraceae bacterium]|jgi:PAS domain S-box-containing protein|nr:ATP-binding protein [Chthoniobacteraceae bacterium]
MTIRAKLLIALLGMSLLAAMVGAIAVNRQRHAAAVEAPQAAEDVARLVGYVMAADHAPDYPLTNSVIQRLHARENRDIEVVDLGSRIVADVIPSEIGSPESDLGAALAATLHDGATRVFDIPNPRHGPRQIAAAVRASHAGPIIGAVVVEYTSEYEELMAIAAGTVRQVILAALISAGAGLLAAVYIGKSIVSPLRQLTRAAAGFAAGQTAVLMPCDRKDEIGELCAAFMVMMEKRKQAKAALILVRDTLEQRVLDRTRELAQANAQLQTEAADRCKAEARSRHLAEALVEEHQRLSEILDSLPLVIFENSEDAAGSRNFVSKYVETMFGYSQSEWFSRPDFWTDRIHPDDREAALDNAEKFRAGLSPDSKFKFRWTTRDNRVIWAETYRTRMLGSDGQPKGIRGFTLDITDRVRAEEELKSLHAKLMEASREAGQAEVATNVLHSVGNVLNSVNISSTLAIEQVRKSSAAHLWPVVLLLKEHAEDLGEYLSADPIGQKLPDFLDQLATQLDEEQRSVLEEMDQLARNIEHIKDIVAVQQSFTNAAGVCQQVGVEELVEDSVRMNSIGLARHGVNLIREYHAHPVVTIDKHKVIQILINLVSNAKYACDASGCEQKQITIRVSENGGMACIQVMDNGIGIPPENLTRIFSHGFTTRKDGHGYGLHSGALAAREIGGTLAVHSDGPARGATFTLELPIEPPKVV